MSAPVYVCNGHYLKKTCLPRNRGIRYGFHELYRDEAGEMVMPIGVRNRNSCIPGKLMVVYQYVTPCDQALGGGPRFLVPCSDNGTLRYAKVILNRNELSENYPNIGSDYSDSMCKLLGLDANQQFEIINSHPRGEEVLARLTRDAHRISTQMADTHYQKLSIRNRKTFTDSDPELDSIGCDSNVRGGSGEFENLDFDVDNSLIGSIYKVDEQTAGQMSFTAQLIGKKVGKAKAKPKKKPKMTVAGKKSKTPTPSDVGEKAVKKSKKSAKVPAKTPTTDGAPTTKDKSSAAVGILGSDGKVAGVNTAKADRKIGKTAKSIPTTADDENKTGGRLQGAPKPDRKSKLVKGLGSIKRRGKQLYNSEAGRVARDAVKAGNTVVVAAATQKLVDKGLLVGGVSGTAASVPTEFVSPERTDSTVNPEELEAAGGESEGEEEPTETKAEGDETVSQFANPENISYSYGEYGNLYDGNRLPAVYSLPPEKYGIQDRQSVLVYEPTIHGNASRGQYAFIAPRDDTQPGAWPQKFVSIGCSCNKNKKKRFVPIVTMANASSIIAEEIPASKVATTTTTVTNMTPASKTGPLTTKDVETPDATSETTDTEEATSTNGEAGDGEEESTEDTASEDESSNTAGAPETNGVASMTTTTTSTPAVTKTETLQIRMPEKVLDPRFGVQASTVPGVYVFYVPGEDTDRDGIADPTAITRDGKKAQNTLIGDEVDGKADVVIAAPGTTAVETIQYVPKKTTVIVPTQSVLPQQQQVVPYGVGIPYRPEGCIEQGTCIGMRRKPLAPLLADMSVHKLPHTVNGSQWIRTPYQIQQLISSVLRPQIASWCHSTIDRISTAFHPSQPPAMNPSPKSAAAAASK